MEGTNQLLKGINYGTYAFTQDSFAITRGDKPLLKVPLSMISNSTVVNKQDVTIEVQGQEEGDDDCLAEMRFYIPPNEEDSDKEDEDKKEEKEDEKEEDKIEEEDNEKKKERVKTTAEVLNDSFMARANISQAADDIIVNFIDLPFVVPRGKYSCDLSANSLRMHGATFNHIIQYKHISKAYLLPKPDEVGIQVHVYFVLSLDKPVRQGNTSYPHLVMQIKKETVEQIKVKLTPEQIAEQYDDKLKPDYEGNLHDIVAKVFKAITKVNIIIPGDFQDSTKHNGVKCSVRASEGHLYFLIKSLIFVPKPVINIKLDDLKSVEFHRTGQGAQIRLFDISMIMKNNQTFNFSGIDKKELEIIMEYFNNKKIPIKTVRDNAIVDEDLEESDEEEGGKMSGEEEDESEDEDFIAQEEGSDDDEDEDFDEEEDDEGKKKKKK